MNINTSQLAMGNQFTHENNKYTQYVETLEICGKKIKKMRQGLKKTHISAIKCGKFDQKNAACIITVYKPL